DGIAITLCDPTESSKLRQVERIIRMKLPVAASHLDQPDPVRPRSEQNAPRPQAANDDREAGEAGERRPRNGQGKPKRFGGKPGGNKPFAGKPGGKKPFRGKRRTNGGRRPAERAA